MVDFHAKLCEILSSHQVKIDEIMSGHTTFRVGGPASYFVLPDDEMEMGEIVCLCNREQMPYYVLGNGSNLLVSDQGYDGVIIYLGDAWNYCRHEGNLVTAGAGIPLSEMAKKIWELSLTGFEFAAGIPGSLGGAIVMNAGAYGSEMKQVIHSAKVLSPDGQILTLSAKELELGYRTSCIPGNRYIVLEATVELTSGDREEIYTVMEDLAQRRRSKQPLEYPSAGSTFKRPAGYFAGKLIQDTGLRGYQVGGAQISEKHCGFVINKDHATAADVMKLCSDVRERVIAAFGVELDMEIKKLGNF